jgi:hypothetical protein
MNPLKPIAPAGKLMEGIAAARHFSPSGMRISTRSKGRSTLACARQIWKGCSRGDPRGYFERGEIGSDLFRAACRMGLEGLVSKRRGRPYRGGPSKDWLKVKNRTHPAMARVMESFK